MTISVIIPAYNAAAWLPRAIRSVLAQTRRPEEIVVVDDGSSDNTEEICAPFAPEVRYERRENGGLSAARNTGLAATTGEWFLSLDADDILYPQALEVLSARASAGDAGVVYGFVLQRREPAVETRLHSLPYAVGVPPAPAKAAFWWTPVATLGSALVRRDLNEAVGGFDESFRQVEDAEYWLRCGVMTAFAHCDQIVLDKTYSPNSLGQQQTRSVWFRLQLQLKFLLWCRERGIDTAFLETDPGAIIDHALTRAWRQRDWALLEPILGQAKRENIHSLWCLRARAKLALLKLTGRAPASPAYCREIYKDWLRPQNSLSAK
jgi:glycosyltransferase involved in cell wall biosynthesis